MAKFRVCEVVWYEVEADTCGDAVEAITGADNRDDFFVECEERYAVPLDDDGNATGEDCNCPSCLEEIADDR